MLFSSRQVIIFFAFYCCQHYRLLLVDFRLGGTGKVSQFVSQSTRTNDYVLPDTLQLDEQLKVLGWDDYAAPMLKPFHSTKTTLGLIEQFIANAPLLSGSSFRIVDTEQWASIEQSHDSPVLFFNSTWKMNYRRLPP